MFSDSFLEAISKDGSLPGYALELDLPDGFSRSHTGIGEIVIDGFTYLGVGELGKVGTITEVGDSNPGRVSVEISQVESVGVQLQQGMLIRGRAATLYVLVFHPDGRLLYAEPNLVGMIADSAIVVGDNNTVQLTLADDFEQFDRPVGYNWSDNSHQALQKDDRICRNVAQMPGREIGWGSKFNAPPFKDQ
ncbi:hypothetical protein [Vibrio sp. SCSIO 43136]|uniref:hypothetical protein n=1 Tax=Vibrio sp. SCSIO 43136 TaxID=2819101 RepID=UPI002074E8BD|nr:hypothetical protein [Vibrio sp. SCSIO 43136]USD68140.1 hypothetical protein J4N39_18370 [Vibrio sp. SCSIO 43136]